MTTTRFVAEFHSRFRVGMRSADGDSAADVRVPEAMLRFRLIKEELEELREAVVECDSVEVLDALGDIVYVVDGAALVFGLDEAMENVFLQVLDGLSEGEALNPDTSESLLLSLREAILRGNVEETAEALGTIKAYTFNTAKYLNLPLLLAVKAIHKSNMSKLGDDGLPIYREGDRKILKGPNYKTPTEDLETLLFGWSPSADISN